MRAIALGALLVASTALAAPKPKEEAKRRIDRAATLHKQGKFDDALAELEAAYKLDPQVDLLFSIGQVYAKLGRCDEARTKFEEFAAKKKSKEASAIVQQAIAACIPKAPPVPLPSDASSPAASPSTSVSPSTTESSSAAAPSSAGASSPTATSPAAAVSPGTSSRPTAENTAPPTFASATSAPVAEHPITETPHRPWYRDPLGDGLVLTGIAAVVVGAIEYHSAASDLDAAESASSLARYNQLVDDAHGKRTVSVVMFAGGAALVGAGIVRYALHDRGGERSSVAVVPAQGGGLVTFSGGF